MENETNKQEEIKEQPKTKKEQTRNMLESAQKTAENLKAENDRMEANIKKLEELKAYTMLGGNSDAGEQQEKPKEETPAEYRDRILKGQLN